MDGFVAAQSTSVFIRFVAILTRVGEPLNVSLQMVDQILLGFHSRFATEAATKVSIRPSDDVLIQFLVNLFAIGKVFSFSEVRGGFSWFSLLDWSGRILYLFLL